MMEVKFIDELDKLVDVLFKTVIDNEINGGIFKKPIADIKAELKEEIRDWLEEHQFS